MGPIHIGMEFTDYMTGQPYRIICYENGRWLCVAVNTPVENTDLSGVKVYSHARYIDLSSVYIEECLK